jgi:hypothetical protein
MPKKKAQPKKKIVKKKKAPKKTAQKKIVKKRSQKVNSWPSPEMVASWEAEAEKKNAAPKKVVCFNMECKLRRAGCYGYEACPGFKVKG